MSAGGPTLGHQQPAVQKEVTQFMEPGHWFVSLYNDDGDPQEVTCLISLSRDMTLNCPRGCNANGECILGRCQCKSGFGGDDCSESKWLVLSLGPVSFVCQPPSRSFPSSILSLTIFSPPSPLPHPRPPLHPSRCITRRRRGRCCTCQVPRYNHRKKK